MIRKIMHIDSDRCNGCGLCVDACHEGAIGLRDGKAVLLRDDYCDGLGDCLPVCPTGAITFTQREAADYDHQAVQAHLAEKKAAPLPCGCPGSLAKSLRQSPASQPDSKSKQPAAARQRGSAPASELRQWPVQLKLVPVRAPYFEGADLLIAADCTAFSHGDFHDRFMRGRITLIGCPKLDEGDYAEKLTEIFSENQIRSVTVVRMEVPCCGGIVRAAEQAADQAAQRTGRAVPVRVHVLTTEGAEAPTLG